MLRSGNQIKGFKMAADVSADSPSPFIPITSSIVGYDFDYDDATSSVYWLKNSAKADATPQVCGPTGIFNLDWMHYYQMICNVPLELLITVCKIVNNLRYDAVAKW